MIKFLLALPTWVGCMAAMGLAGVTGYVVYFVFYKIISKYQHEDMKDPTSNLFRVVGMLVSLMLALAFLLLIGTTLIAEGFGAHVPKGYIYAAMTFSAAVEALNMLSRRARQRRDGLLQAAGAPNGGA